MGPHATKLTKKLAQKIAEKRGEKYSDVTNFIRTKIRFSLLRSVLIAVRGERGRPTAREPYLGTVPFNMIPEWDHYDC